MLTILKRSLLRLNSYLLFVGGLMLVLVVYYGLICTDRYVSRAAVIVQNEAGASAAISSGLFSALAGSASSALDAELVKAFIESPAMLEHLDRTLGLRQHFSQDFIDPLSRLDADATSESFLAYYLRRIEVEIDLQSMIISVDIQGFAPEYAQKLAKTVVARAEQFVNDISQQLAREQVAFIENEIRTASERLQQESNAMIQYQQDNQMLSVDTEAQAVSAIIGGLQNQLSSERTELKALLGYLNPGAAEVVTVQRRIAAIEQQIRQERERQVGGQGNDALNQKLLGFKELELRVTIATQLYQTGLQTLETARLDAAKKVKYLVLVSPPTLPQSSQAPRRMYILTSAFLLINAVYLIGKLLIATIKDHKE